MFIEYVAGEKHAPRNAEISEDANAFSDCGYLLKDDELVVDIDCLSHPQIEKLISIFDIDTQLVWTDRGVHMYFAMSEEYTRAKNGVCALGFKIETKNKKNSPGGVTVKRNGVMRKIDGLGKRQEIPWYFCFQKKFDDMNGLSDGEGRNNALFQHRMKLGNRDDANKVIHFINDVLFADPLDEAELQSVCREYEIAPAGKEKEFELANQVIRANKCVNYQDSIWLWDGKKYVSEPGRNKKLKKIIFRLCPGKSTHFVDEVIRQIEYRAEDIDPIAFPIKLSNGIVGDGKFTECEEYTTFTPYYIDIPYKPEAATVLGVDDYIDSITGGDPDYRKLLLEAMAYVLVTDPDRVRSIGQFFMLRGDGANGKGTLLQIMKKIYGPENCTSLSIKELTDDRYQVTMIGKLANLGDDIQPEPINHAQMKILKNVSTADTISTRRLYKESFNATFTAKMYFTTNADIRTFEKGYAYKRRVTWLPMFNKIEKPDPMFISKMTTKEALEYWMKLLVEAYIRLYRNGHLTKCALVDEFNEQYHIENNYMAVFLQTVDIGRDIIDRTGPQVRELYETYNDDDSKHYNPKMLEEALAEMGIGKGVKKFNGQAAKVYMRQEDTKQKILKGTDEEPGNDGNSGNRKK